MTSEWPAQTTSHEPTLELSLAPEDLALLARRPDLARAAPSRPTRLVWFDDPSASLADQGRIVEHHDQVWRLEALDPGHGPEWPPCSPPPVLDEATSAAALSPAPPFDTAPVAAFDGKRHAYRMGEVRLNVLHGSLHGLLDASPRCRLRLSGPTPALAAAVSSLAGLRLAVPRAALAREALAVAKGGALPPRHLGAPSLDEGSALSDGLGRIIGHLLDAMLHWMDAYRRDAGLECVHQGRVATRRLRSALSLYRRGLPCPELDEAGAGLRSFAAKLGAARDWDVFMTQTAPRLDASGTDPRVSGLLRAAKRRRLAVHAELAAYLAGAEFRRLELALGVAASLRPWERDADPATLASPTADFAAAQLHRRLKHVRRRGKTLDEIALPDLHELRKDCKKLRYAAEFFAPCFPGKQVKAFLKRLSALQEELGALNDTAAASHLMTQLGRAGRGYAAGIVEGWAAAITAPARARVDRRWKKFRAAAPFWAEYRDRSAVAPHETA